MQSYKLDKGWSKSKVQLENMHATINPNESHTIYRPFVTKISKNKSMTWKDFKQNNE